MKANTIFYVRDQKVATEFYSTVLGLSPTLDVPGMTEFQLSPKHILGLMPEAGIKRLLGAALPDPSQASGIPRAELYLTVEDPEVYHARALQRGAIELSGLTPRNWGHEAAYSLDPDGHVLVFARPSREQK
ncbi:MAG TPA: VOC family protein [Pseudobdellovibrionaceae bacterium]|nr:VOC family protein [Pseudobdellovibrionaceae bacterium]